MAKRKNSNDLSILILVASCIVIALLYTYWKIILIVLSSIFAITVLTLSIRFYIKRKKRINYNQNELNILNSEIVKQNTIDNILTYQPQTMQTEKVVSNTIDEDFKQPEKKEVTYTKTNAMSEYERSIFSRIQEAVNEQYFVFPQVNLASIIDKNSNTKYRTELFRNIDFGIFDMQTSAPLVLIELNDKTHTQANRYTRDLKVREILNNAGIPLITLYSGYDNATEYIKKRIAAHISII